MDLENEIEKTIKVIKENNTDQILTTLQAFVEKLGYDNITYVYLSMLDEETKALSSIPKMMLYYTTVSDAWAKKYTDAAYYIVDPVHQEIMSSAWAFAWDVNFPSSDPTNAEAAREMMEDAANHGYPSGVTIPLHGPLGFYGCFTLFNNKLVSPSEYSEERLENLHIAFLRIHEELRKTAGENRAKIPVSEISKRELECLHWASLGKTAWETGEIIGISQRTVRFHLTNAREKLQVSTNSQAIARLNALRLEA